MSEAKVRFGKEIKKMRKTLYPQRSQTVFADKINLKLNNIDFQLTQKKVSDIERAKDISVPEEFVIELSRICDEFNYEFDKHVLEAFLDEIRDSKKRVPHAKPLISVAEHGNLISMSNQRLFEQYIGTYNCLFHSTDSSEPKCICGIMEIKSDQINEQCKVEFSIIENGCTIKKYEGPFFFNTYYNMWYCILVGKPKQEVCLITAQHFNSTLKNNLFNIALVITTSAGLKKRPTMHRMFISRDEINEEKIELILPQLRLNDDTIFISESNMEVLATEIQKRRCETDDGAKQKRYDIVMKCIEEIRKCPSEKYYRIDEAILYDSSRISQDKKALSYAISKIRGYTENKYYNKLSDTIHEICTQIIKLKL